mgnify:CR=1 FL=1
MKIRLPDGRVVNIRTDDPEQAKIAAAKYYNETRSVTAEDVEASEVSSLGDIGRGIGAGAVSAMQGLATLPWEVYDAVADPEESRAEKVRQFYEKFKPVTYTGAGEAAKFITQFAVPGTIAAKIAKARKLGKMGEYGALAGTDFAVATQDVETLGDFFDAGPTSRTPTEDLDGAERAAAELGNRLKVAGESAALILGIPAAFKLGAKGVGKTISAAGQTGVGKGLAEKSLALFDATAASPVGTAMTKIGQDSSGNVRKILNKFTFKGDLPDSMTAQIKAQKIHEMSAVDNELRRNMESIDKSLTDLSKAGVLNSVDDRTALNALDDYLFGREATTRVKGEKTLRALDEKVKNLSKDKKFLRPDRSLFEASELARKQIDGLSQRLSSDGVLDRATQEQLIETVGGNMHFYGSRLYRALRDPKYKPSPEQTKAAMQELIDMSAKTKNPLSEQDAINILNDMMSRKEFSSGGMKPEMQFERETLTGIGNGILKGRKLDNFPAIRDFLGEYSGSENIFGRIPNKEGSYKIRQQSFGEQKEGLMNKVKETTEGVAKMITKHNMFRDIDAYNTKLAQINPGSEYIVNKIPLTATPGSYSMLGELDNKGLLTDASKSKYGPLAGKYIKTEYINGLDNAANLGGLLGDSFASNLWSTFLMTKGLSQMAKTVYSPVTQIRNATTAAFFAIQSGNVGNGKSLLDSMQTVFSQIGDRHVQVKGASAKALKDKSYREIYDEYTTLGVVNTNVRQGEFEALMKDAVENRIGSNVFKGNALKWAEKAQNNFATKVYQGSDDVWKIYNYEMELGKLNKVIVKAKDRAKAAGPGNSPNAMIPVTDYRNLLQFGSNVNAAALPADQLQIFLKREAASITKDLVPNYVRVPEIIRQLRVLPLGNFIAFPAEIIRTSGNTLQRAIKEVASESPEIREIGMRRLAGMATVNYAGGRVISSIGHTLTGSSEDQTEAYKRSFAPEWERNSQLIPVATDKDGNVTEFYNYSYTNPYDYLTRPIRGVWNAVNNGVTEEKELMSIAGDALGESAGEFFSPFLSEPMVLERAFDLVRNQTNTGRKIWNEADNLGTIGVKGFSHLVDAIVPSASPYDLRRQQWKDFPKAMVSATGLTGPALSNQGVRLDPAGEFAEAISGLKTVRPVMEQQLYYRGIEAAQQIRSAGRIFSQVAKKRNKVEAQAITDAYLTTNEQRFKELRSLNMAIEDARTLGMSEGQIARVLKRAGAPDYKRVMHGTYSVAPLSKQIMKEAYRADRNKISNPYDFEGIGEVRKEFINKPFRPEAKAEAQAPPAPPIAQAPAPGAMPPPSPVAPPDQSLFKRGVQALRDVELDKLLGT